MKPSNARARTVSPLAFLVTLLILVLAACNPGGGVPGFTLSAPSTLSGYQSDTAQLTVTIERSGGFTGPIELSLDGSPPGVAAGFGGDPTSGSRTLTLTIGAGTAIGAYTLEISGQAGSINHAVEVSFSVAAPPPVIHSVGLHPLLFPDPASNQVSQGFPGAYLIASGERLTGVTGALLGGQSAFAMEEISDVQVALGFLLPADTPVGPMSLTVTTASGTAEFSGAVMITPIVAGPGGSDADGIGTFDHPYRTLTEAVTHATSGDTVHLLDGSYDAAGGEAWPVVIPDGVAVEGESRAGTGLDGALVAGLGLQFAGDGSVAELSLFGFGTALLVPGGAVEVSNVDASHNTGVGLVVQGSANVEVSDSSFDENQVGIFVQNASTVSVSGSVANQNAVAGMVAGNNAQLSLTSSRADDNLQIGIFIGQAAELSMSGGGAAGNGLRGLWARDSASAAIQGSAFDENLYGVYTSHTAELTMSGGSASRNARDGFFFDQASSASLSGVAIVDNDDDKLGGVCFSGIAAFTTGELTMRSSTVEDNCYGMFVAGSAALLDLGTAGDAGGNTFAGNASFQLADHRPALGAPTGTVITTLGTSFAGLHPSGGVKTGAASQTVGPNKLWEIVNVNQRIEFKP